MTRISNPIRGLIGSTFRPVVQVFDFLRAVARDYSAKRLSIIAAGLAYYTFLAFFPFVLVMLAAAGYALGSSEQQYQVVENALTRAMPTAGLRIREQLDTIVANRAVVGGLGLLALVWTASNAFAIIIQALRIVWEVKVPSRFVVMRLRALALLAIAVVFLLLSVLASSAMPVVAHLPMAGVVRRLGELPLLWWLASAALSLAISFLAVLVLYRIVPTPQIKLRHEAAGAAFAAVSWELAKSGFAWYLQRFANFDRVYGPVGAIVILLLWIYISAVIVLVGAEIAAVYAVRERGPGPDQAARSARLMEILGETER
ncbi:MAG: YihY/virulence factor BrkB family protein [Armatimonadota bacterium]|nr:MAG: YihY/virulence factor BrkB family protein [Armatimonadota bacterium]